MDDAGYGDLENRDDREGESSAGEIRKSTWQRKVLNVMTN